MPFDLDGNFTEFPIEKQQMSNWCWAACTSSVCDFFRTNPGITQRQLVSVLLKMPICNLPKPLPPCNKPFDFGEALNHVGHLSNTDPIDTSLTQAELANTIKQNFVGCQMEIPGVGGHAVIVISGKTDGTGNLFLHVADPSDATILTLPYLQLRNNYRGLGGRWIRTYIVKE